MILLTEEILHQLISSLSHYLNLFTGFYTSQVVQDFFHQQYEMILKRHENLKPRDQRIAPIIARIEYKGLIFGSNFGITFYRNLTVPTFGDLEKPLDVKMGHLCQEPWWQDLKHTMQWSLALLRLSLFSKKSKLTHNRGRNKDQKKKRKRNLKRIQIYWILTIIWIMWHCEPWLGEAATK